MQPVRLVLAVQDKEYVELLLQYVQGSEYAKQVQITAFTRVDAFLQAMEHGGRPDLVVGDSAMLKAWLHESEASLPWAALLDGGEAPPAEEGLAIPKYQPLSRLLDSCIRRVKDSRSGGIAVPHTGAGTVIVGVASALGGCGKTTVAVNAVRQLGVMGRKVFYLNLETANTSALFPAGQKNRCESFSRLLYDLKSAAENGEKLKPEPYVIRHDMLKCETFEAGGSVQEMMEMTCEDTAQLIRMVAESGRYDVVIVDGDVNTDGRFKALVEECHLLLWLLLDDLIGMHKTRLWFQDLEQRQPEMFRELAGKCRYIVNRYTGALANTLPRKEMILNGTLPFIPSWKQVQQEELLLCSPIFQREILKLLGDLLGDQPSSPQTVSGESAYA